MPDVPLVELASQTTEIEGPALIFRTCGNGGMRLAGAREGSLTRKEVSGDKCLLAMLFMLAGSSWIVWLSSFFWLRQFALDFAEANTHLFVNR